MPSSFAERPISARQQKSRNKQQKHGLTEEWGVPHTLIVALKSHFGAVRGAALGLSVMRIEIRVTAGFPWALRTAAPN